MAVPLDYRRFGAGPPALVLHGLLGQGRNWQGIARRLAKDGGRSLVLVDLRNHGRSPRASPTTYEAMAGDLARLVETLDGGPVALVGHSMGGKAAMVLALERPDLVERLAVVDVAPVAYDHGAFRGYMEAMRAIDLAAAGRRAAVEALLQPVDPDPRVRAFLASNLEVAADGLRWLPDLDRLLEDLPAILGFPEQATARRYRGPVLFLCGALSRYVLPDHEPLIRTLFPQARLTRVEGAGHWVHADRPDAVIEAIGGFLQAG